MPTASLIASEARLRVLLEASLDAVYFLHPKYNARGELVDFVIEDLNERAVKELGMKREALVGFGICELFPINLENGYFESYKQAFLKQTLLEQEYEIPEGHVAPGWYQHRVVPMPGGLAIYNRNVSDIKAREAALKASEEAMRLSEMRFRSFIEQASDLIFTIGLDGLVSYISPNVKHTLGYSPEEVIGQDFSGFVHPEDLHHNVFVFHDIILNQTRHASLVYRAKQKDGTWRWHDDTASAILDEHGQVSQILVFSRNITKEKQAEEALKTLEALRDSEQHARQLADDYKKVLDVTSEQNLKLKSFTYIISHNIRSHSANFTGLLGLLQEAETEAEKASYLDLLRLCAEQLDATITNLNEVISVTENTAKPKVYCALRQQVERTLDILSGLIHRHRVQIEIDIAPEIQVLVIPAYLDSILLNLLSNALKYCSPERDTQIKVWAEFKAAQQEVCLAVSDNGLGLNLEKYGDKLFGMYKTFHGNEDARGFGLYITKTQVEAMGGLISVESQEGQGSTFKVCLHGRTT